MKVILLASVALNMFAIPAVQAEAVAQSTDGAQVPIAPVTSIDAAVSQDAASPDIVVTGFRRSLEQANQIKRNADSVVDAISAEDIGEFPDQNLAESLQRITGVQISRNRGEGGSVAIRGLGGDFVRVQYNGRTLGSGGSRSFDFVGLSALFTSAVEVTKSPTADMIEGGLAGTINVRTARPLDVGRTTVTGSAEAVYEELPGKVRPRLAGLVNWVNGAGTFGVNLGIAYEQRRFLERNYTGFGAETSRESPLRNAQGAIVIGGKQPAVDYNVDGDVNDTYSFEHAPTWADYGGTRTRKSLVGSFQAKPVTGLEMYGDLFFTDLDDDTDRFESNVRATDIRGGIVSSTIRTDTMNLPTGSQGFVGDFSANGLSNNATYRGERGRIRVRSGALGIKLGDGPFRLNVEGAHFTADNSFRTFGLSAIGRASATVTRPGGLGEAPSLTYVRGYDGLNASNFYLLGQDIALYRSADSNWETRADASYDVGGFLKAIRTGAYYNDRSYVNTTQNANFDAAGIAARSGGRLAVTSVPGGNDTGIRADNLLSPKGYSGIPNAPASLLYFDIDKMLGIIPSSQLIDDVPLTQRPGAGFDIKEETIAAYARADFGNEAGTLSGNLGVRYVRTSTSSTGIAPNLNGLIIEPGNIFVTVPTGAPTSVTGKYQYFLPSFNIRYNLTDDLLIRGAAARVLGRPGLGSLSAGTGVDANTRQIFSGNPQLRPYLSDQLDLSLEYYLPKQGLLSAAIFYKHLSNYILSGQTTELLTVSYRTGGTATLEFRRNQPLNLATGNVKGVELAAQIPLSYLSDGLEGLGLFGNYTYIAAPRVPRFEGGPAFPLDGISKHNFNVGAYLEKGRFAIRGSYSYRDELAGGSYIFGDGLVTEAYGQLDASTSFKITKNVSLSADVTNVLNAKQVQYNGFGLLSNYSLLGRRFTAGANFRF